MAKGDAKEKRASKNSNSAVVVGAGMAGIRSALDLAEAGYQVTLIDQQPNIGGVLMQLDRQFPTNDCGICKMLPTIMRDDISDCCIRRNLSHPKIKILTNSTVTKVTGSAGEFTIEIHQKPQYVDSNKCISCGKCEPVCPVEVPNEFNDNFNKRKAIFTPYPLPNPNVYTLDMDNCTKCGKCVEICPTDAIDLDAKEYHLTENVGSVILAPGLQVFDPGPCKAYGYGLNPNILTSIDFERIYSGLGPYSGERKIVRPSDNAVPKNLAFIQCVGSRDAQIGNEYCSFACCMYSLKEAMFVKEQNPKIDVTIFYMDMRAFGKGYHEYYEQAKQMGINFIRCRVPSVQVTNDNDNLELILVKENDELTKEEFEMVVLGVGLEAPKKVNELSEIFKIDLNEYNFSQTNELAPVASTRAGIYVCGGFTGPKDIPETVTEASAAAALAAQNLSELKYDDKSRIDNASQGPGPDVEEEPRIGVLFCTCGNDIDSKVDLSELKEFTKSLSGVIFVDTVDFLCIKPEEIKNKLEVSEDKINRLIITACTPYKFETQFKIVTKEAGLSPDYLELIDFRERLAWICTENKTVTTALAKSQLAIAHEKMFSIEPLSSIESVMPVTKRALVVGGGLTGMTSAITISNKGYPVDLVEKSDSLGGNLLDIFSTLTQEDVQGFLNNLIKDVEGSKNINIHLNSKVQELTGYVGNFQATIAYNNDNPSTKEKEYGAVVLATGAEQYQPKEYLYGEDPRVLTQLELECILAGKKLDDKDKMQVLGKISEFHTIVMIQCVGSRNSEHPYCSRVCCAKAIKNALKFKKKYPGAKIYVVYQDIMTYGLMEKYYLEARREGIEFIRYEAEKLPEVRKDKKGNKVIVKLHDILLNQTLDLEPDLLVLSTGIVPNIDNLGMFNNLNLDYTSSGFLKEANVKFRPVDMLTDGIFIAGLVHSPRLINESITQAQAAGGRVLTILNKPVLPIRWDISEVIARKCSGCEACISACPYSARVLDTEEKIAKVLEPLCQGCGTCAMVCPNSASIMRGAPKGQVYSMIDAAVFT